ncbi:MAG: permease [marine bacterium B5-7]|nr:MAG: permease [marine bacterium B5-7]
MSTPQSIHIKGLLIVTLGVVVLSFDALLVRLAGTTPWNVAFWRGVFIFIALGSVLLVRKRGLGQGVHPVWGLSIIGSLAGVGLILFPVSILHTSTANTVVILTSAPFFAALFSRLFLREKIPTRTWTAIAIVFFGIAGIFSGSLKAGGLIGDLVALVAAINFGLNMTLLRSMPNLSRVAITCLSGLVSCLLCLPLATPLNLPVMSMGVLAVSGLFQMPTAMVLIATGTRFLPAAEVSLLLLVETLLAPVWVWFILSEQPPLATVFSGSIILATLFIHSWLGLREQSRNARLAKAITLDTSAKEVTTAQPVR